MTQPQNTGYFGPPPPESVAWSQPDPNHPAQEADGSQAPRGATPLPDGSSFTLNQDVINSLVKLPGVRDALIKQGEQLAAEATTMSQVPNAKYEAVLVDDGDGVPSVMVQAANDEARYDAAAFSTLHMAYGTAAARGKPQDEDHPADEQTEQ